MNIPFELFFIIFASYLIGSLPTAVIISKVFFGFDIRNEGSGNMGSTNAFRILGWKWGVIVQLIDITKGVIVVIFIANHFGADLVGKLSWISDIKILQIIAGISAVAGHIWSLFVNFRGGKGVNTAAGMLLGLAPIDFGVAVGLFPKSTVRRDSSLPHSDSSNFFGLYFARLFSGCCEHTFFSAFQKCSTRRNNTRIPDYALFCSGTYDTRNLFAQSQYKKTRKRK